MKSRINKYLIYSCVSVFLLSCEKAIIVPSDVIVGQDIALSHKINNIIQDVVNQTIQAQNITTLKTSEGSLISAASIKVDTVNSQDIQYQIVFDGTPIGLNNTVLTGTIYIAANGKKHNENGLLAYVTSNQLVINGININNDMNIVVTNVAALGSVQESWSFTQDYTMTFNDGSFIDIAGNGKRYQTDGFNTSAFADDSYKSEMQISGSASNAVSFTASSSSPIIRLAGCKYFTGGTINWVANGNAKFIDFGNGSACDAIAIVTVNGKEIKATLQ